MTMTTDLDRATLAQLVARLDALLATDPPPAAELYAVPTAVAPGELIQSAWGNNVVTTIEGLLVQESLGQATINADTGGSSTLTIWNSVTIANAPEWANSMIVSCTVTGAYEEVGTGSSFQLALNVNGTQGTQHEHKSPGVASRIPAITIVDAFACIPGSNAVAIYGRRVAGTGILRADPTTQFRYRVSYRKS